MMSPRRFNARRRGDREMRVVVFQRDNFTCRGCGWRPDDAAIPADYDGRYTIGGWPYPRAERYLHLDHVSPYARGGQLTAENLQTLCEGCNCSKGARA